MVAKIVTLAVALVGLTSLTTSAVPPDEELIGLWKNKSFGTSGPLKVSYINISGTVTMSIDFDGGVFGGTDPDALILTGPVDVNETGTLSTTTDHPTFGPVSGTVTSGSTLHFDLTDIPSLLIRDGVMDGTLDGDKNFAAIYRVNFTNRGSQGRGIEKLDFAKGTLTAKERPLYQPDLEVGKLTSVKGGNVWENPVDTQVFKSTLGRGKTKTYAIVIGNDGTAADGITLKKSGAPKKGFIVTYFLGATDITADMESDAGYGVDLARDSEVTINVTVQTTMQAKAGSTQKIGFSAVSVNDSNAQDNVLMKIKAR